MYYSINTPNFGDYSDPRTLAELAHDAEEAGWDGFFIWDHILIDPHGLPMSDPWVTLAAIAMSTQRIRIGTMVTPLSRRRPWKLAREAVSIDHLSGGRLILGIGLGDPVDEEFGWFGEETDAKVRAKRLDEALDVLVGLWSGKPFSHSGEYYQLKEMTFLPTPVQSPRIPIWVGGWWPHKPPFRRAARWDGMFTLQGDKDGMFVPLTPDDLREVIAYTKTYRTSNAPFEVTLAGETPGDDKARGAEIVAPYIEAGLTWWTEDINPWRFGWKGERGTWPIEQIRSRILAGPPKV